MSISREEFENAIKILEEAVMNGNVVNEKGYTSDLLFTQRYGLQVIDRWLPNIHVDTLPGTIPGRYTVECNMLGVRFKSDKEILKDKLNELDKKCKASREDYTRLTEEREKLYQKVKGMEG